MLASIYQALKPGGRLVIIDFDLRENSTEMVKQRARAPKEVYFREVASAGFEWVQSREAPRLRDNFLAVFWRVERGAAPATKSRDSTSRAPYPRRQSQES